MKLRGIDSLQTNRDAAALVDGGLADFSDDDRIIKGMCDLEWITWRAAETEGIVGDIHEDFRRVGVRGSGWPELVHVDRAGHF